MYLSVISLPSFMPRDWVLGRGIVYLVGRVQVAVLYLFENRAGDRLEGLGIMGGIVPARRSEPFSQKTQ